MKDAHHQPPNLKTETPQWRYFYQMHLLQLANVNRSKWQRCIFVAFKVFYGNTKIVCHKLNPILVTWMAMAGVEPASLLIFQPKHLAYQTVLFVAH